MDILSKPVLTRAEVCKIFGISFNTELEWRGIVLPEPLPRNGKARRLYYSTASILAFLENKQQGHETK